MEKLFVSHKLAMLLKEKGFDEPCLSAYERYENTDRNILHSMRGNMIKNSTVDDEDYDVAAPLYQQVIDWFREKHNIHIWIEPEYINGFLEKWFIQCPQLFEKIKFNPWKKDYYQALNKAIEEAIKLL